MKAIEIRLKDDTGRVYKWPLRWVKQAWLVHPNGPLSKSRRANGWEFESHDGVVRFTEGNWLAVVPVFKLTASNYGLTLCSELS